MTRANGKDIKSMLINKKTISLFFQLSLIVLILLGAGLAPAQASANQFQVLTIHIPSQPELIFSCQTQSNYISSTVNIS